jgi:hypothetical protein
MAGCVNLTMDRHNCGTCGTDCGFGQCNMGQCVCAMGETSCPMAGCVNLMMDRMHCGSCTTACGNAMNCVAGMCM